jgi:hypothetical protein
MQTFLISVWRDQALAEAAAAALETGGVNKSAITILGNGYQSTTDYGLIDPNRDARRRAKAMASWLVPFGFLSGVGFNLVTQLDTFPWAGPIGNPVIGGLLGAMGGAMGGGFIGGGLNLIGSDSVPYYNRTQAGRYVVVIKGNEVVTRQASRILRPLQPDALKTYADGADV